MTGLQYHNVYLPTRPTLDLYNCCCGCDLVVILPGFDLTNAVDATDFDGEVVPFVTNFLVGPLVSCFNGALLVGFAGAFPGIPVLVVTVSVDPSGRVIVVRVVVIVPSVVVCTSIEIGRLLRFSTRTRSVHELADKAKSFFVPLLTTN